MCEPFKHHLNGTKSTNMYMYIQYLSVILMGHWVCTMYLSELFCELFEKKVL